MSARSARNGFTLLEVLFVMVLIGLVLTKLTIVVNESRRIARSETTLLTLEEQASQVVDRIAFAIIGADAETIDPGLAAPFSTQEVDFRISLGVDENGEVLWGEPEKIGLRGGGSQLFWGENVGGLEERLVVWCNTVSEMLEDELLNGFDDNGNQLADELGLSFDMVGRSVTVRLTVERENQDGELLRVTEETVVTCRN